ncbi:MAG: PD40 domain-containing protein [Caldilineaceae bacterium]|nr:PD40 domain-containing protein [Caldilineaceae bacterium]
MNRHDRMNSSSLSFRMPFSAFLTSLLLVALLLAGCAGSVDATEVAVAVALTQTAAAMPAAEAAETATPLPANSQPGETPTPEPESLTPEAGRGAGVVTETVAVTTTEAVTDSVPVTDAIASPEQAELEALVSEQLELARIAEESEFGAIEGVSAFQLTPVDDSDSDLWVAYTFGLRSFDPLQNHVVAIYARVESGWQELARMEFTESETGEPAIEEPATEGQAEEGQAAEADPAAFILAPDYLGEGSVRQVFVEPTRIWLEVQGGAGAHSGTYHVLSYDGETLSTEVENFTASPGGSKLVDLNKDGLLEAQLDVSDPYVFCYACGVRVVEYQLLHWNGTQFVPVTLSPLTDSAPADLRETNDRAIKLAQAGLWKDALETVSSLDIAGEVDPVLAWNALYIQVNADAKRAVIEAEQTGYPLLSQLFYGDYAAALEIMRAYTPEELFSDASPLVAGTVAEGNVETLSERLINLADSALTAQPDLGEAYFIRAWGAFLVDGQTDEVQADLARAAELLPRDEFVRDAYAFLGGDPAALPTPADATQPATAETITVTAKAELNLRGGPGTDYAIVGSVAAGDEMQATGRVGADASLWLQVTLPPPGNQTAWITGNPNLVDAPDAANLPLVEAPLPPVAGPGMIYFSVVDSQNRTMIYRVAASGDAEPEALVENGAQPSLQPGGVQLAFQSTQADARGLAGYSLDTGQRVRYSTFLEDAFPTWNPAGNRLVFASNRHGDRKWRIYVTWADQNNNAEVVGFGQEPDWHPSQDTIVFKGCDDAGAQCGLWTMLLDGSVPGPLTAIASDSRPMWSPDGSFVVFMSDERDGNWELYRVEVADGAVTRLTDNAAIDGLPALSPDGSEIVFLSNREDAWALWTIPAGGGVAQRLAAVTGEFPDWRSQGVTWADR